MDFLMDNLWVLWLIVAAVMLVVEISTAALVSIWFVFGAVLTAIIAAFWDSFVAQVILFFVVSAIFLIVFRSMYKSKLKAGEASRKLDYSLIGRTASAAEEITQFDGKVLISDVYWKAICEDGVPIPNGSIVTVIGEDGTTLKVKKKE